MSNTAQWGHQIMCAHAHFENQILSALPLAERLRLNRELQDVAFTFGGVVYEPGATLDCVYFPTSCVASLIYTTASGVSAAMGVVGKEGALGLALLMGGDAVPYRTEIQVAGRALKLKASVAREEFGRGGALQEVLLRYTQRIMTQISQTAVCNRLHSVEQRLCRWILLCIDRLQSDVLVLTQESIANMLGGRRQSVTTAAGRLQKAGLICYARGHIKILDRVGLENAACECYHVVKNWCQTTIRPSDIDVMIGAEG